MTLDLATVATAPRIAAPERSELRRRIRDAVALVEWAVVAAERGDGRPAGATDRDEAAVGRPLDLDKVVAEATMLLRAAEPVAWNDRRLARAVHSLASKVEPLGRRPSIVADLCRHPARALDHAMAAVLARRLGYGDGALDALLDEVVDGDAVAGHERLPNHELEHRWLRSVWTGSSPAPADHDPLLANTCAARPLDLLSAGIGDLYAFTHVVLYATDLGRRRAAWPRPTEALAADADGALAVALDADNLDLAAELLWTWPMIGLPWSATATFAWRVLAEAADELGFLPGPELTPTTVSRSSSPSADVVLRTSYHATLAMGILSAAACTGADVPPASFARPPRRWRIGALTERVARRSVPPRWWRTFERLDPLEREALAGFVGDVALIRCHHDHDLVGLRDTLADLLADDLVDRPVPTQALVVLRRAVRFARAGA